MTLILCRPQGIKRMTKLKYNETLTSVTPAGMPSGSSVAFAKAHVREILRREFNRSVELQVSFR